MSLSPGARLGPYEIIAPLGAGGMGEVYRAHDPRLGRKVAIKILPAAFSADQERLWRFEREAKAVASLNHPHICTIHDIGDHEGHRYLVMELMDGQPLNDRLKAGPLPNPLLIELAIHIADALDAAHRAGVIHRDLKPANIFVTKRGEAKLLDFGLAKVEDDGRAPGDGATQQIGAGPSGELATMASPDGKTTLGSLLGTATYMSPEQARGEAVDARSDLFSFGAVLYEMATGRPPFSGKTLPVLFDAILNKDPQPAAELNPQLPQDILPIIDKALEKDADLRYQNAADLRADLKRLRRDAAPRQRQTDAMVTGSGAMGSMVTMVSGLGKLTAPSGEANAAPKKTPAAKPLSRQPLLLGGIALAAVALIAVIATTLTGLKPGVADNERAAFFGFTAAGGDALVTEIAAKATEETYAVLGVLQVGTAARGDTQGVPLDTQLDRAAALGARYALGGTVRAGGDQVSVNIRLDDVGTRATLWQETMTGGADQRESLPVLAASRASNVLKCLIRIRPEIVREDASALALVTRACQLSNIFDREWITLWRDVERIAPRSSYAQVQLSTGWLQQSAFVSDAERPAMLQESRATVQRRLAIAPEDAGARAGLAMIDITRDRPLAELIAAADTALQEAGAGGDRTGMDVIAVTRMMALGTMGRNAEAARRARLDAAAYAVFPNFSQTYGPALWNAGQKLEARTVLDSSIRRHSSLNSWTVRVFTAIADGEDIAPILAAAPPAASAEQVACWRDVAKAARASDTAVRAAGGSRLLGCVRAGIVGPYAGITTLNLLGQVDAAYAMTNPLLKRSNPGGFLSAGRTMFSAASRPMRADARFLPMMRETGIYQYWLDTKTQPDVCETPEEREFEVCVALRKDQGR